MLKRSLLFLTVLVALALVNMSRQQVLQAQEECAGQSNLLLRLDNYGQVLTPTKSQTQGSVRLRAAPTKNSPIISLLASNSVFVVADGPRCKGDLVWWRVISETGVEGWLAQGDSTGFYVAPLNDAARPPINPVTYDTEATPTPLPIVAGPSTGFGSFHADSVDVSGKVPTYQFDADLTNVLIANLLNHDQRTYLVKNGFVVSPARYPEFADAYKEISASSPTLITPDSLLHSFHLVFDKVLRSSEEQHFLPLLRCLNAAMLKQADQIYQASRGTTWEDAAKHTVAYIGVSTRLADPSVVVPKYVQDLVTSEVTVINNAGGTGPSAIFPQLKNGEDWTQYKPRGHYTKSEDLGRYFRAMMYFGRMTFRMSEPEETKSALLLITAIQNVTVDGIAGIDVWKDLYEPTVFFVGKSDDLSITQYIEVMQQVYGKTANLKTIQSQDINAFVQAAKVLPAPRIVGMLVMDTEDVKAATQGLRFMGQRFVWDAYAFSQLMYKYVGTRANPRGLPIALDIFAVMGSARARQLLDQAGTPAYVNYDSQMAALQTEFGKLTEAERTETLYHAWLYIQNTLAQPVPSGYPAYMMQPAYADRLLSGALGSFAELKHDTILYAKQPEALGGGGPPCDMIPPQVPQPTYVEPVPLFWARLAALAEMTDVGLGSRNLLNPMDKGVLRQIANLARRFERDSVLELNNQPLGAQEQSDLSGYYVALQIITQATGDAGLQDLRSINTDYQHLDLPRAALVADIASDANKGLVLEVATGNIFTMDAVVPIDGKLVLARGAVYSYYEFQQPMANRLTDEQWQAILLPAEDPTQGFAERAQMPLPDSGQTPPAQPAWLETFTAPSSSDETILARQIRAFQIRLEGALYVSWGSDQSGADDPIQQYIHTQQTPLEQAGINEERQILATDYGTAQLSADGKTATVITKETWQGKLHARDKEGCPVDAVLGKRGPYTIQMKYTFTRGDDGLWMLTNVSPSDQPPAWTDRKPIPPTPTPDQG